MKKNIPISLRHLRFSIFIWAFLVINSSFGQNNNCWFTECLKPGHYCIEGVKVSPNAKIRLVPYGDPSEVIVKNQIVVDSMLCFDVEIFGIEYFGNCASEYFIEDGGVEICQSSVQCCLLFIAMQKTACTSEDPIIPNLCHNFDKTFNVCLGDTSNFFLTAHDFWFQPRDVHVTKGTKIEYDRIRFDVVWHTLGIECFGFSIRPGDPPIGYSYQVNVQPKIPLEITSPTSEPICQGEMRLFSIQSEGENYLWTLSDGRNWTGSKANIDFDQVGDFYLTVKSLDECQCTIPDTIPIQVKPGGFPEISCVGSVCAGTEVTYTTPTVCDNYQWEVSPHGTVIAGGEPKDAYTKVLWQNGDVGTLTLSTDCITNACKSETSVSIPILDLNGTISGKDTVCLDNTSTFKTTFYEGTNYQWYVNDQPIGMNQPFVDITFISQYGPTATIRVVYENCFLGCLGEAEKVVVILPEISIFSIDDASCQNTQFAIFNNKNTNLDYVVISPDQSVMTYSGFILYLDAKQVGEYIVTAYPKNELYCNKSASTKITVYKQPEPPSEIIGPSFVCIGDEATFTVPNLGPNEVVYWEINAGSSTVTWGYEPSITYIWKSNVIHTVRARIENLVSGCFSTATTKVIGRNLGLVGLDTKCFGAEQKFFIDNIDKDGITWTISPDTAAVVLDIDGNGIKLQSLRAGDFILQGNFCQTSVTKTIHVLNPIFDFPIITQDTCFPYLPKVIIDIPPSYGVDIINEDDEIVSNNRFVELPSGLYTAIVNRNGICPVTTEKTFGLSNHPTFSFELGLDGPDNICVPTTLATLFVTSENASLSYTWYRNNILLPETDSLIQINASGNYSVVVSDENGCQLSNNIEIGSCCDTVAGVEPFNVGRINHSCNEKTFRIFPPYQSTNITWRIIHNGMSIYTVDNINEISYTFTNPGLYYVSLIGDYCITSTRCGLTVETCESYYTTVFIPEEAAIRTNTQCDLLTKTFKEIANQNYDEYIRSYQWDFGDPTTGPLNVSTEENPSHTFSAFGNYEISLEVEFYNGCVVSTKDIITISDYPEVITQTSFTICEKASVECTATSSESRYKYKWNFGEPGSLILNEAKGQQVSHLYAKEGNYVITLETYLGQCKVSEKIIPVSVIKNTLIASITSNLTLPKCPSDTVTLTALPANLNYIWNTTETTSTILVTETGNYRVTVTDNNGCKDVSDPFLVSNNTIASTNIIGRIEMALDEYRDSIDICVGNSVNLRTTPFISGATYTWQPHNVTLRSLELPSDSLPVGRHVFSIDVSLNGVCQFTTSPFVINVRPYPDTPIIDKNGTGNCISEVSEIFVTNPQNDVFYKWSGNNPKYVMEQFRIVPNDRLSYEVEVKNIYGCSARSNEITLGSPPSRPVWMTGCLDLCFPTELCINTKNQNDVYLYKDDVLIKQILPSDTTLEITSSGSYYLRSDSDDGCTSVSETLDISAQPISHNLSGIAYVDINKTNTYEVGIDSLLPNVKVGLWSNNNLIQSIQTDTNGYYHFDTILIPNLEVRFDPFLISSFEASFIDSSLYFSNCNEEKVIDFGLQINCIASSSSLELQFCEGDSIQYLNELYLTQGLDTVAVKNIAGCDSIIYLSIKTLPNPNLTFNTEATCDDHASGQLTIQNFSNQFQYFLNDSTIINDSMLTNISLGSYELKVVNNVGCVTKLPFQIDELPPITFEVNTQNTCKDMNNGTIDITSPNTSLTYKFQDAAIYSSTHFWSNLAAGSYSVFIEDEHGCLDTSSIYIDTFPSPSYSIKAKPSCFDNANGSISLGNNNQVNSIIWREASTGNVINDLDSLSFGKYLMTLIDVFGCITEDEIFIDSLPRPSFEFTSIPSCENNAFGTLIIKDSNPLFYYQIDNLPPFQGNQTFENLSTGPHQVMVIDTFGCTLTETFVIDIAPSILPDLTFDTKNSCIDKPSGSIIINGITEAHFEFNGLFFSNDTIINNLTYGNYIFTITDSLGCEYTKEVSVDTLPEIAVTFPTFDEDCYFNQIEIIPIVTNNAGNISYEWNTGAQTAKFIASQTGNYSVTISDQCESRSQSWNLDIQSENIQDLVYTPNIFSRQSKGINNCFKPTFHKDIEVLTIYVRIFDRWGNKVFETKELSGCWDGYFQSKPTETGVYVFIIDYSYLLCNEIKSESKYGDVTIIE
ncbi:MAG TPA: PKD domain-containing protein [Saprospiraceae bacterium]|nr:PKD domain-containing protein [Saprospiraceae bacterium]